MIETKTILFYKELETYIEDGIEYTAYRCKVCRVTTVNNQIIKNTTLAYQDWICGESCLGLEQTMNRYYSHPRPYDEFRELK